VRRYETLVALLRTRAAELDVAVFARISAQNIERLAKAYKSVDDIDLYIGCLAETAVGGSQLGPTAQCVVGEQFLRTKKGDRFFYENGPDSTDSSFTPGLYR